MLKSLNNKKRVNFPLSTKVCIYLSSVHLFMYLQNGIIAKHSVYTIKDRGDEGEKYSR